MERNLVSVWRTSVLICIGLAGVLGCGMNRVYAQQQLTAMRLDAPMATAAVSPDGRYAAVNVGHSVQQKDGSWNNGEWIEVIEPSTSSVVARVDIPGAALLKDAPVSSTDGFISYCDNGKYLAAYDLIGTVYVLNAGTYRIESRIALGNLRAQDAHGTVLGITMACSAGGSIFAVSAYGGRFGWGLVRVFDLTTGGQIAELRQNPSAGTEFRQISLSPDGSKLAILLENPKRTAIQGPNVEIRETKHLTLLNQFTTGDAPRGLAFAGESEVVTVQEQPSGWSPPKQALRLWDVESGKEERRFSDAHLDVDGPISSSADGKYIAASITKYHECRLCNGLEGRRDVTEQRFAVWNKATGAQIYRSEPYRPIVEPLGPEPVLSQNGGLVMVYWPDSEITPRLFPLRQTAQ